MGNVLAALKVSALMFIALGLDRQRISVGLAASSGPFGSAWHSP
jgi:hypothetical protein